MLKSLNFLIARCVAEQSRRAEIFDSKNDVLEHEVSLFHGDIFMLTCNLWFEVVLVNGALGYVEDIYYMVGSNLPKLLVFSTVIFEKYTCVPFDINYPNIMPVIPVVRGNLK